MTAVRRIKGKNVTGWVEAHGEVLFFPTGQVTNWQRSLTQRIREATIKAAPTNKRPRWSHYGPPLKKTIRASTTKPDPARMRAHSAVGSTANYAVFVDQGTNAFQAKILPPWGERGYHLYEHTWVNPDTGREVGTKLVSGQRAQRFLDEGVSWGFASMGLASITVPGGGAIKDTFSSFPDALSNFVGATPVDAAFRAQLAVWRSERDQAFAANDAKVNKARRSLAERKNPLNKPQMTAQQKYNASKEAADRRKKEQEAALRLAEERKALAETRRQEAEEKENAATRLRIGNSRARTAAREFYNKIRQAYPNAQIGSMALDGGVVMWQVRYTDSTGQTHSQKWAYGY